jgi:hypothetical protein
MNFFCKKKHLIEWQEKSAGSSKKIYGLNLVEALTVAKRIFG